MTDSRTGLTEGFRLEELSNGWVVGRFAALEAMGIVHLVTTRRGPDVQQVRHEPQAAGHEIARVLGFKDVAFLKQMHGGDVLLCDRSGCAGFADGLVTTTKGLALMGKSGDCPIVLIADRCERAVGFAHASWRATVAGITPVVVSRMVELGCEPGDLVACICPSAGPECYEVGEDVRTSAIHGIGAHAEEFFRPAGGPRQTRSIVGVDRSDGMGGSVKAAGLGDGCTASQDGHRQAALDAATRTAMNASQLCSDGGFSPNPPAFPAKYLFDLWRANTDALVRAGLEPGSIHVAGICTLCRNDLFPSHRREGNACGRFAAVVGLPESS